MAMIAGGEFATESGEAYLESTEALSNQYYSQKSIPGPMKCEGNCTMAQQLLWATQMEAWYSESFVGYISTGAWISQLGAAQSAIDNYHHGADTSWFWGEVSEGDLFRYALTITPVLHEPVVYPNKPYFIVYEYMKGP